MRDEALHLTVAVEGRGDADAVELDDLTGQLRRRLLELDVADVAGVRAGDVPDGARPVDPMTVGALAVTLAPAVLQSVVALVESWVKGRRVRSVKLALDGDVLELGEATPEQQQQLLEAFLDRHGTRDRARERT